MTQEQTQPARKPSVIRNEFCFYSLAVLDKPYIRLFLEILELALRLKEFLSGKKENAE